MASVFRCKSCSLGFEVGWDHYHQVHRGAAAETSLVCRWCGTWYILDHKIDGTSDELYWRCGPVSITDGLASLPVPVPGTPEKQPVPTNHQFRPVAVRRQIDQWKEGLGDTLELARFICPFCNKEGKLTDYWSRDDVSCPRCLEQALTFLDFWMT